MKKLIYIALSAALALCLAACGGGSEEIEIGAALSGTVSTDGSTSMEKVIGALKETFEGENKGVEVTYNPTGSSAGITAVAEGRPIEDAIRFGCATAGISVTRKGTAPVMPTREEVEEFLIRNS